MRYIESLEEFEQLLATKKLVVVDFTATWCGPCKMISPKFEAMATEWPDVTFVKVDVDKATEITEKYSISAMPTFIFFRDGNKVTDVVGADESKLRDKLRTFA